MGYELSQISDAPVSGQQPMPSREEKVVSMYNNDQARYTAALAKLKGEPAAKTSPEIAASNTNEGAAEQTAGGASLPLSPQLAALARKEQKFRQEQAAFKAEQQAKQEELKLAAEYKALKAKIEAGDYSDIDKMVDYEKLVQHKIGKDPKAEELEKVNARIQAMEEAQKKDIDQRYEQAVNQRRSAVKTLIAGEEYPTIKGLKAEEAVVQHILDTWENDEVELSPEDAAKEVEEALLEKASKWAALVKPKVTEQVAEKRELPPLKDGMKTLTNQMASTGEIKKPMKPLHMMTDDERYKEAYRRALEKQQNRG